MRLIVVDDDRLVVDSLKIILGAQPQIEVVAPAPMATTRSRSTPNTHPISHCSTSRCRGVTDFRQHAKSLSAPLQHAWCF